MLSDVSVHYCSQTTTPSSSNRIVPGPKISIEPEFYYANDNIIGYTYNITLNGFADALRLDQSIRPEGTPDYGVDQVIGHIDDIRSLFNFNGGDLHVMQGSDTVLVARGATIKSMNFNESNNKWVNYAPYTIDIEFNEVDFVGCSGNTVIPCSGTIFHNPIQTGTNIVNNNIIDMRYYKVKEFKDQWTFTVDDEIYDSFGSLSNNQFKISYNLSATGKNYYVNGNVLPAWLQAKNFVQNKLQKQIKGLIGGILTINDENACDSTLTLSQLHQINTSKENGALSGFVTPVDSINSAKYQIYNEIIKCDTSESDGTFSITYDAILKKYDTSITPRENAALHTFTKNITYNDDTENATSVSVQGTVQGLIHGGFIYIDFNDFELPDNGTFISKKEGAETKYYNAYNAYLSKIGDSSDLSDDFKQLIGLDSTSLLIEGASRPIRPLTFSLDHNYHDGSISYNASYDQKTAVQSSRGYSNITITRRDPVELVQEFMVPGRSRGPIIQKLNTKSSRIISINIEGASKDNIDCCSSKFAGFDVCSATPILNIASLDSILDKNNPEWILTKEDYNTNKIDGSFSINLEYLCRSNQ